MAKKTYTLNVTVECEEDDDVSALLLQAGLWFQDEADDMGTRGTLRLSVSPHDAGGESKRFCYMTEL